MCEGEVMFKMMEVYKMENKLVLTIKDVMQLTGLARNSVTKLIKTGQIRSIQAGKRILIPQQAFSDFLDSAK